MRIEIGQIIGQIISFLIMLWVMKRYAWKPFMKILEDRQEKIQTDFNTIDAKTKEVDRLSKEYQDKVADIDNYAKSKTKEAIDAGEKKAAKIESDALAQAKTIISKAQTEMHNEIEKAKEQLKDEVVTLAMSAASKIMESKVDKQKQQSLVSDFINQMESK